jgi:hypothetical protein
MPVELVIAPEAELDIAEAYAWYEGRRVGLGEEFLSSVDACIEGIRRRPAMYPVVHEGYRRALTRFRRAAFARDLHCLWVHLYQKCVDMAADRI